MSSAAGAGRDGAVPPEDGRRAAPGGAALRRSGALLGLVAAALVASGALLAVGLRGPAAPTTLGQRVQAVASGLRCPVCEDLSVADSPSALAGQMRASIAADLRRGMGPAEVRRQFVQAYGPWILLTPPRRGLALVAWLAPLGLFLAGLLLAAAAVRRWLRGSTPRPASAGTSPAPLPAADRALLERALAAAEDE